MSSGFDSRNPESVFTFRVYVADISKAREIGSIWSRIGKSAQHALMTVTLRAAKIDVLKLIEAARAGDEVVSVKGQKPVASLTPIAQTSLQIGFLKESYRTGPNFFELMDEDDIAA
ncbi:hypothetical protein SAMN02927900_02513 [Rhizobium mongolense subsp. loessense]|uniref:Uncharacterized protein n=1 Tax=Rhizobium mongolense subsp. loessense TaxID=158890 RepID=A0A1G4RE31_9HYPH|nr:hypothetical protein [Rhizobium mongolense]SCW55017.1 hypothetical protein SAMN02927900_02513 [Rhizobium mongolense subsp. loessense]